MSAEIPEKDVYALRLGVIIQVLHLTFIVRKDVCAL